MNNFLSKYLLYYPVTFLKGEWVHKYLQSYTDFQWKSSEYIESYQLERLENLISYAYENSTFYHYSFKKAGIGPNDIKSLKDINKLPYLSKEDLIEYPDQITAKINRFFTSKKTTGGSTGQAVTIVKNADALARERAATWRAYKWAGIDIGDPQAMFWGIPLNQEDRIIYKAIDFIANRKRLSAFNINEKSMEQYFRGICKFKPIYFYGYVSMISEFANFMKSKSYKLPYKLKSIITTSEVLDDLTRNNIENTFGCKVFNEYGCGEVGSIAHECEYGKMHIMADNIILEIEGKNSSGEIIVTDLFNYAMPLIRYRLKDFATLSSIKCECGRTLPAIERIHGRAYDIIKDIDGNQYHAEIFMYIFEEIKKKQGRIKQFQVIQKDLKTIEIKIVPGKDYNKNSEKIISSLVHNKIHNSFNINFTYETKIQREKSGKIRLIKSQLIEKN